MFLNILQLFDDALEWVVLLLSGYFVNDNHLFSTYMLGFVTYDCFGGIFLSNLENITYYNYYEVSYLRDKDSKAKCGYLKPVSGKAKFWNQEVWIQSWCSYWWEWTTNLMFLYSSICCMFLLPACANRVLETAWTPFLWNVVSKCFSRVIFSAKASLCFMTELFQASPAVHGALCALSHWNAYAYLWFH